MVYDLCSEKLPVRVRLLPMCRGELSACEAGNSAREELKQYPPPFSAVLWFVMVMKENPNGKRKK